MRHTKIRCLIAAGAVGVLSTFVVGFAGPAGAAVSSGGAGTAAVSPVWCRERTALGGAYGANATFNEGINIPVTLAPEASRYWSNPFTTTADFGGSFVNLGNQKVAYHPWVFNDSTRSWTDLGWRYADLSGPALLSVNYRPVDGTPVASYRVYVEFSWLRPSGWTAVRAEWAPSYSTTYFNRYTGLALRSGTQCTV